MRQGRREVRERRKHKNQRRNVLKSRDNKDFNAVKRTEQ